jgi:uncharacterized protein with FMN-binding domain
VRRAILATLATAAGLVALLGYKSSGTVKTSNVAISLPPSGSSATTGSTTTTTGPPSPSSSSSSSSSSASSSSSTTAGAARRYTGQLVQYTYGDIQLAITVDNGKITNIDVPQEGATDPRSQQINSQAIPILTEEALKAQSLHFDVVSGATFTSDAYAQALQSAEAQEPQ